MSVVDAHNHFPYIHHTEMCGIFESLGIGLKPSQLVFPFPAPYSTHPFSSLGFMVYHFIQFIGPFIIMQSQFKSMHGSFS